jgi:hypothetical protein
MSQDTENFDSLRKLLTLKRHEIPPPGYFNNFSREVIVRIKAGEQGEDAHGYVWQMGWLQRLWASIEAKPVLAGGLGLALCGLMVFGIVSAADAPLDMQTVTGISTENSQSSGVMQVVGNTPSDQPMGVIPISVDSSDRPSLHPAVASTTTLFDLVPKPQADHTSLSLTGSVPQ